MRYAESVLELIGNTPMLRLNRLAADVRPILLAKLEFLNPGGSVKDRIGITMVEDAERRGLLKRGGTIVEPTSGNTGVGLAQAAAIKGYRCIFVMPDKMSQEKIRLLKAYGAEVVITPTAVPKESPESYYSVAERLSKEIPNAYQPNQYANQVNPQTHYKTTGPEIWEQTDGRIDYFVVGLGTGGTMTGVARYLKERKPEVKIVGVDTEGSLYTGKDIRPYKIEGIGEDFIPETIDLSLVDQYVTVSDRDAFVTARRFSRQEGLLTGGSGGAALFGALKVCRQLDEDKVVVVLLPDTGRNYLSKFYSDDYMKEHGFLETPDDSSSVSEVLDVKGGPREILTLQAGAPVSQAVELMRKHNISQVPVLNGHEVVGSVQETVLMNLLFEQPNVMHRPVEAVMSQSLPVLPVTTPIPAVYQALLEGRSAVLVQGDDGRLKGILTKIDLIDFYARKAREGTDRSRNATPSLEKV